MTQTDLARQLGVKPQAVQQWVSGRTRPKGANLEALSVFLGVSPAVVTGSESTTIDIGPGIISVPRFGLRGDVGPNVDSLGRPEFIDMIQCSRQWLLAKAPTASFTHLEVFTVSGDSMAPTLKNLDFVFIDRSQNVLKEGVYLLSYANQILLKRIQFSVDGGVILISDNTKFPPMAVPPGQLELITCLGRAVIACTANEI